MLRQLLNTLTQRSRVVEVAVNDRLGYFFSDCIREISLWR